MSQVFKTQFFACLLALLAGWPYFCLVVGLNLTVSLAISKTKSIGREFAIAFSGFFFWKELIGIFRC